MTTTLDALRRGDLSGARELRLSHLGLTQFPPEILALADTLEVLDLTGNRLTSLPNDLGRLTKLRILFCSGNCFDYLPPSLGDLPHLSQIGFRGAGLREIPAESLPPAIRWLTLTDNQLTELPPALGDRPALQKLMLSGNHLHALPSRLAEAENLELLRIAANRFEALPLWLGNLPRLAWLAWSGNPVDRDFSPPSAVRIDWTRLLVGETLGEGASGRVYSAVWRRNGVAPSAVALKLFKGSMTSDGLPEREIAACLAAGAHPNLMAALGRIDGHPDQLHGLVMPLLPEHWRPLAGPPSLESCSRDVYDPQLRVDLAAAIHVARDVALAAAHLHARGLMHGDLYAHNVLWDGLGGSAVLTDFGAASFSPSEQARMALLPMEVLAWGLLLGELLEHCHTPPAYDSSVCELQRQCVSSSPAERPTLPEALDVLATAV